MAGHFEPGFAGESEQRFLREFGGFHGLPGGLALFRSGGIDGSRGSEDGPQELLGGDQRFVVGLDALLEQLGELAPTSMSLPGCAFSFVTSSALLSLTSLVFQSTLSWVVENTILGMSLQIRANSTTCSGAEGFVSAVGQ